MIPLIPSTREAPTTDTLSAGVKAMIVNQHATNTQKFYRYDLADFSEWGGTLPADEAMVADYLVHLKDTGFKLATIKRRVAAIGKAHVIAGFPNPCRGIVKEVMKGIIKTLGAKQVQKKAIDRNLLLDFLHRIDTRTLKGKRDKALLLLAFSGALRGGEVVGIRQGSITFRGEDRMVITLYGTKTDPEQKGQQIPIANGRLKVIEALQEYLHAMPTMTADEPIFKSFYRDGNSIRGNLSYLGYTTMIKSIADQLGMESKDFAGHSLRAGYITTAVSKGINPLAVMKVSRHRNIEQLSTYYRSASLFDDILEI